VEQEQTHLFTAENLPFLCPADIGNVECNVLREPRQPNVDFSI